MISCLRMAAGFALAAVLAWTALAQEKVAPDKLPEKVKQALQARFPRATITQATREVENGAVVYDIEMTRDGKKHEMDCKEDGTIVDIQNEISERDLPAAALKAIREKHPNCQIKEVGEILVVKDKKETRDHFEVLIETADKRETELTVSLDGTKIE